MIRIIIGLLLPILFGILLFIINPIFGILWTIWIIGVAIFTLKRNKRR